jgi:multiple sugar transport system permease protein
MGGRRRRGDLLTELGTWLVLSVFLFPVVYLILTSLKTQVDAFKYPPVWIFRPTLNNYTEVFDLYPFGQFLVNSLVVASVSTCVAVLLGAMAAYALARFTFRRSKDLAFWILSIRMTPPVAAIIPIFILMRTLGLLDSRTGLIIAYTTMNLPFATWLLRGFFREIPRELDESALVDGCSWLSAFLRVALPLAAPGLVVTAIFVFIFSWNEFLFALILTATRAETLPVAVTGFIRETGIMWGHMAAAGVVIMAPMVLFSLAVQRYLVRGLTMGAIK